MFRRISGVLLFLWMATAVAMAIADFDTQRRGMLETRILSIVSCIILGLIGLLLAVGKKKV
jgi:cytochrome c biogenesis factor